MPDEETLNRRLRAVERSLSDGDEQVEPASDAEDLGDRVSTLESQLADAEDRITELEAVTQALRGYVGNVRSVNDDVEQRADAALAAVERLEQRVEAGTSDRAVTSHSPVRRPDGTHAQSPTARPMRHPRGHDSLETESDEAADNQTADDEAAGDDADGLVGRVRNVL